MSRYCTDVARRGARRHRTLLAVMAMALSSLGRTVAEEPARPSAPPYREPNPYLSFLPAGAQPDYRFWQREARRRAAERRHSLPPVAEKGAFAETEPNDSAATADFIAGFGTGGGDDDAIDVTGRFAAPAAPLVIGPFAEDEGSIPLASDTGLRPGSAVRVSGTIGDGPFGSGGTGSGDFDFFKIPGVLTGQLILVDVDTALPFGDLDPNIALYDSAGNIVRLNDDQDATTNDSFMAVPAPIDDDYYLSIGGSLFPFVSILSDPFDSSTGMGIESEGAYEVTIGVEHGDQDWFSFELEPCDILGLSLNGAGHQLLLQDPAGELLVASSTDLGSIAYPEASPLPIGGRAVASYVAATAGTYSLRAIGDAADYVLELRLFRQPLEMSQVPKTLFVDFDGAVVDPGIFGFTPGTAVLSPLSSFLADWGLTLGDEDAVIDAVLAALEENLDAVGPQAAPAVVLLNSRDHADPFGLPGVSRLIVGGTIPELGIPTIGIAQSIDPGNFETAETAVILLDLLSRPPPEPDSLNSFPLAPGASIIDLIGVALGNIAAHEAGHYVGNFHTEQFDPSANIMDRGGNLPNTIGVGPDGVFGNADDDDVDFGENMFADSEGFAGVEDTLAVVACGCTVAAELFVDGFESGDVERWSSSLP